jgi:DNA invertase Pin-like site-specific DNA recombinase
LKVALYARVSKGIYQNPENQVMALEQWALANKHQVVGLYIDEISSRDTRPEKERVLRMFRMGEVDGIAFWSLDRWGRTLSELVLELEEFSKSDRVVVSLKEGIDLSSAAGRMFANMLAVFANFERDRIQERTLQGTCRARAQGKVLGRHPLDCGCGAVDKQGSRHNGQVKPMRDEHNVVVGWLYPGGRQVPIRRQIKPPMQNVGVGTDVSPKTD